MALWQVYGIEVGGTLLAGIGQVQLDTLAELEGTATSGQAQPERLALREMRPRLCFRCTQLGDAIDLLGLRATNVADLAGGLKIWLDDSSGGGRAYSIARGIVVPRFLRLRGVRAAEQGKTLYAELEYEVWPTWNGADDLIAIAGGLELPDWPVGLARRLYSVASAQVAGVAIDAVAKLEIEFASRVALESAGSDIWPSYVSVEQALPTIELTTTDLAAVGAAGIPLTGRACAHGDTRLYFRASGEADVPEADDEPVHLLLTAAGLAWPKLLLDHEHPADSEAVIAVQCRHDGANEPIEADTEAVIP